ncbi:MAG: flagellar basal body rod protein FlgB [Devosia sp.]|nr:flagellar basal body rod protein FlgB [Devosia sp.]
MDGMSLLNAMTAKMRWHQQRQDLLAQNVANANTPNYRGQELQAFDFASELDGLQVAPVTTDVTDSADILGSVSDSGVALATDQQSFEVTPEGNGVTVEDEMMKVSANQMDYQAVTSLYTKSLQLIRTALGHA